MISIITPIHNCLPHNEIFWESLCRYSYYPFELIVVDNHSTDGSYEFFQKTGCTIIRNENNLCYPESMNQGILRASHNFICLLNNDVFVGLHWDKHLLDGMAMYNLDVVSPCGIERMSSLPLTHYCAGRWRQIGEKRHLGESAEGLRRLLQYMYGDWPEFCRTAYHFEYPKIMEGIVGNCVMIKREVLDKLGMLDERIQAADWDLYLRVRARSEEEGDVHRVMTVCWAYVHHFIRTTLKSRPAPFACTHPRLRLEEKWDRETIHRLWPFPHEVTDRPSLFRAPLRYWKHEREKIESRTMRTEHENQWLQFWKELDRT